MVIKMSTVFGRRVDKLSDKFKNEIENMKKEPVRAKEYKRNEKYTRSTRGNQQQIRKFKRMD